MAIAVQSYDSNDSGGTSNVTVTKPTGLAVGDLMIAVAIEISTTQTGWTLIESETTTYDILVFSKVADSADVAASDFTFTSGVQSAATIYRIDGQASASNYLADNQSVHQAPADASNTQDFTVSLAPVVADSIILVGAICGFTIAVSESISGYSLVGQTNPTWTEAYEKLNSADDWVFTSAYATLSTNVEITELSYSVNQIDDIESSKIAAVVLTPTVDASGTTALLANVNQFFAPTSQSGTTGTVTDILVNTDSTIPAPTASIKNRIWTNETRPS